MDLNQRTSGALLGIVPVSSDVVQGRHWVTEYSERATRDISALLQRFENIIEYKPGDRNAAAVNAYRMEVETAALIRAAEDILSLTRVMKEMWLFGTLQTVGTNEAEKRAEESARGVEEGLRKWMGDAGAET
ncbi:MAG: hypothetical protein Q9211_003239 [Gyalolechia sp. 1 TL-2023]